MGSIRYHETLETLLAAATEAGISVDERTVVVRNTTGQLLIAHPEASATETAAGLLREKLGNYLAPVSIVGGSLAERLLSDPALRLEYVEFNNQTQKIQIIDRRSVGRDWMRRPALAAKAKRLVFGSLKGGVGRSTALAVLAADLALKGKKVLAIDLDLEAPGIGSMLLCGPDDPSGDRRPKYGAVDYLLENSLGGVEDDELYDFVGVSAFSDSSIDVIPAVGRVTDDYPELMVSKLSRALVDDVSGDGILSFADQVSAMVDRFEQRATYDVVLIDARAGLSEITAAPLLALGAEILLFAADQPQTIQGYAYLLAHMMTTGAPNPESDWRERITFVHSKAPSSPKLRQLFKSKLYDLCAQHLYDADSAEEATEQTVAGFTPGPSDSGRGVPHDAIFVTHNPDYNAFDPLQDVWQLDPDVYRGPFGAFLESVRKIIDDSDEP